MQTFFYYLPSVGQAGKYQYFWPFRMPSCETRDTSSLFPQTHTQWASIEATACNPHRICVRSDGAYLAFRSQKASLPIIVRNLVE